MSSGAHGTLQDSANRPPLPPPAASPPSARAAPARSHTTRDPAAPPPAPPRRAAAVPHRRPPPAARPFRGRALRLAGRHDGRPARRARPGESRGGGGQRERTPRGIAPPSRPHYFSKAALLFAALRWLAAWFARLDADAVCRTAAVTLESPTSPKKAREEGAWRAMRRGRRWSPRSRASSPPLPSLDPGAVPVRRRDAHAHRRCPRLQRGGPAAPRAGRVAQVGGGEGWRGWVGAWRGGAGGRASPTPTPSPPRPPATSTAAATARAPPSPTRSSSWTTGRATAPRAPRSRPPGRAASTGCGCCGCRPTRAKGPRSRRARSSRAARAC